MMTIFVLSAVVAVSGYPAAFADGQEKLDFAAGLEEALGHFWALELNLDESNAELATIHALHPITELYVAMKPQLQEADAAFDIQFKTALEQLETKASTTVSRNTAQASIDAAKSLVEQAREKVVGDDLSNDPHFKMLLINTLLETSISEYYVAISDGVIGEMAEFQDGYAFVWRAEQIFMEVESHMSADDAGDIEQLFKEVMAAYDDREDPAVVDALTSGIISRITVITEAETAERLDFAAGLEEALGHFWALELNLDERDAELARIHALHPITELYVAMKPQLQEADAAFDNQFRTALEQLENKATTTVSRSSAQSVIDDAKDLVEQAREKVVGEYVSDSAMSKLLLMKSLLETSIAEYDVAVSDGVIGEMAEFQDGSAFVWRSEGILDEIASDIDADDVADMRALYEYVWMAYDDTADPAVVNALTSGVIDIINDITGSAESESPLQGYIDTIRELLADVKTEYRAGNVDLALSYATKAYLDNYEFLEGPLVDAGERDFMVEVETLMREDLRNSIRNGVSAASVDAQVDTILGHFVEIESILIP